MRPSYLNLPKDPPVSGTPLLYREDVSILQDKIAELTAKVADTEASLAAETARADEAEGQVTSLHTALDEAEKQVVEFDANVDRLKACEHIADGDDGWERLRNECPSTAAVARLRDALVEAENQLAELTKPKESPNAEPPPVEEPPAQ